MKKFLLGTLAASVMAVSGNALANFVAGQDYQVVANPISVEKPGKIEVREFFWYGCGHCHSLEPHMQTWLKKLPKNVRFVRTPAAMNPVWEEAARAYYVSEALGVRQKSHLQLFYNIHHLGQQQLLRKEGFAKFFTRYGISEAKFNTTYNSFPISAKIAQAKQLAQAYQLTGVPAVTVNGKYVVQGDNAKVVEVVNYLVDLESKNK
jgi:protein dithiol oxidoreductase (disulfide-forming)